MICQRFHLKDYYSFLADNGCDPTVTMYAPDILYNPNIVRPYAEKPRPCILICPGGAYSMCSDREAEPIALHFLPAGYNVFVLDYSVVPNRYPTQLREIAAAMELIHQNAADWHCDPSRIAICGFSAGGHLAAHYSTCYDCDDVRACFPDSKPVQATILGYPVITADARYGHLGSFQNLIGHCPTEQAEIDTFSCDCRVTEKTPPAFLWHTAADSAVPVMNTYLYAGALSRFNIPAEVHVFPAGDHGLSTVDTQTNNELPPAIARAHQWLCLAEEWLKYTL